MPVVEIEDNGSRTKVDVPAGQTLLSTLRKAVPAYISPCGGNHTCGKCLVEAAGGLSGISEEERKLLPAGDRFRLACCARILGDCYVRLPHRARKQTKPNWYRVSRCISANMERRWILGQQPLLSISSEKERRPPLPRWERQICSVLTAVTSYPGSSAAMNIRWKLCRS